MMRRAVVRLLAAGKPDLGVCTTPPPSECMKKPTSVSGQLLSCESAHGLACEERTSGSLRRLPSGDCVKKEESGEADRQRTARQSLGLPLQLSAARLAKMGPSKGRGPLIAKFAPVGFKKGFGAVGLGRHTKKGFFLINYMLVPKLHVSESADCGLKPYVSPETYKFATQKFWEADADAPL
ncbi:hypothetical protein Efla_006305 [Eimeria flavescens]